MRLSIHKVLGKKRKTYKNYTGNKLERENVSKVVLNKEAQKM